MHVYKIVYVEILTKNIFSLYSSFFERFSHSFLFCFLFSVSLFSTKMQQQKWQLELHETSHAWVQIVKRDLNGNEN